MPEPFLRDPVVVTPAEAIEQRPAHATTELGPGQAPASLLATPHQTLGNLLAEVLEAEPSGLQAGPVPVQTSQAYPGVGLVVTGTGAPAMAMVVEKCIAAGTRRVLGLGFAGAIAPNADHGQVCIVTSARPNDGVTSHYAAPGYTPEADGGLTRTLSETLPEATTGTVWTTDAPYRQTRSGVDQHREDGVLAVDMEMSALLTVCQYREVPAGALVVTTDRLDGYDWTPLPQGAADEGVRDAVRALLGIAKGLKNLEA
ncbi:MAG: hypothetical protein R3185_04215 [Candidatus Thermoplasmatota archaeon]|nr:hypothetical protein [Candidatus Thermoplasmatota archaeon]